MAMHSIPYEKQGKWPQMCRIGEKIQFCPPNFCPSLMSRSSPSPLKETILKRIPLSNSNFLDSTRNIASWMNFNGRTGEPIRGFHQISVMSVVSLVSLLLLVVGRRSAIHRELLFGHRLLLRRRSLLGYRGLLLLHRFLLSLGAIRNSDGG
ncbi:uncharacterized protein G2W53_006126 [Senna tora]|uniref:Uncharacterized protein n=1 Tax=Senna tora TaxID=362788 RepID=A0A835CCM1_9FABA|nr:uncharacterized protein G2W53_006126 [Senna tora]